VQTRTLRDVTALARWSRHSREGKDTMTAREIMTTPVITAGPDATLAEISELMLAHRISGIPIADSDGRLVGIVTESDMLEEDKRRQLLPRVTIFGMVPAHQGPVEDALLKVRTFRAREVMTEKIFTVEPDTPVSEVAGLLVRERINRVPVVEGGKVIGIISRADLIRALHQSGSL
jgi:CBS domain-containing protein